MIYIHKDRIIHIQWTVLKSASGVVEDFGRALVKCFLICGKKRTPVDVTSQGGLLTIDVPQGLAEGVYSIETIYVKNEQHMETCGWESRCIMRTRKDSLFGITEYKSEETNTTDGEVTVALSTQVATYGYDGLDAYELAVLKGTFNGTDDDWLVWQKDAIKAEVDANMKELRKTSTRHVVENASDLTSITDTQDGDEAYVKSEKKTYVLSIDGSKSTWSAMSGGTAYTIDDELSSESKNPVENRAVYEALEKMRQDTACDDCFYVLDGEFGVYSEQISLTEEKATELKAVIIAREKVIAARFYNLDDDGTSYMCYAVCYSTDGTNYDINFIGVDGEWRIFKLEGNAITCKTYKVITESTYANPYFAGVVQLGYKQNGRNYPLMLSASHQAYVNVPAEDVATATTDGLMSASDKVLLNTTKSTADSALSKVNSVATKTDNALLKTEQTLTDDEKTQVKTNLGLTTINGLEYKLQPLSVNIKNSTDSFLDVPFAVTVPRIPAMGMLRVRIVLASGGVENYVVPFLRETNTRMSGAMTCQFISGFTINTTSYENNLLSMYLYVDKSTISGEVQVQLLEVGLIY